MIDLTKPEDVEIEVSINPLTNQMIAACMTITPGYAEWCKEQISLGNEVHTMTVGVMVRSYL